MMFYEPKPNVHPVFRRLENYKLNPVINNNVIRFDCPNTASEGKHTAIFVVGANDTDVGEFQCPVCHISNAEMMNFLGLKRDDLRFSAKVYLDPKLKHTFTDAATKVLMATKEIYRVGQILFRIDKDTGQLTRFNLADAELLLSRKLLTLDFQGKVIKIKGKDVSTFLNQSKHDDFEKIDSVVLHPLINKLGVIDTKPGYDLERKIYFIYKEDVYYRYKKEVFNREDAVKADEYLTDMLSEVPIASKNDLSAIKCAIITAVMRMGLNKAPAIGVIGNVPGVGKSYLCNCITWIFCKKKAKATNVPKDPEERARFLAAKLRNKEDSVIYFDDLRGIVENNSAFNTCITDDEYEARVIGRSTTFTVKTKALYIWNGNNVILTKDQYRRCLLINLHENKDIVLVKEFRINLMEHIKKHVEKIQMMALIISGAYAQAGFPMVKNECVIGFDDWNLYCRKPLLWLGNEEPIPHIINSEWEEFYKNNAEQIFCETIIEIFEDREIAASEVVDYIESDPSSERAKKLIMFFNKRGVRLAAASVGRCMGNLLKINFNDISISAREKGHTKLYLFKRK